MEQEQLSLDRGTGANEVVLDLEARETAWEVAPGYTIKGYGFNGKVPGPTIEARLGATLVVRLKNGLPEPTIRFTCTGSSSKSSSRMVWRTKSSPGRTRPTYPRKAGSGSLGFRTTGREAGCTTVTSSSIMRRG
jgi:FtsP/CotA-like multicopper oxidase with cupredoxin domain